MDHRSWRLVDAKCPVSSSTFVLFDLHFRHFRKSRSWGLICNRFAAPDKNWTCVDHINACLNNAHVSRMPHILTQHLRGVMRETSCAVDGEQPSWSQCRWNTPRALWSSSFVRKGWLWHFKRCVCKPCGVGLQHYFCPLQRMNLLPSPITNVGMVSLASRAAQENSSPGGTFVSYDGLLFLLNRFIKSSQLVLLILCVGSGVASQQLRRPAVLRTADWLAL